MKNLEGNSGIMSLAHEPYWILWIPGDIPTATRERYRLGPPRDVAPHEGLCAGRNRSPQELMKFLLDNRGWKRSDFKDRSKAVFTRIEVTPTGFIATSFDSYQIACAAHLELMAERAVA